MKDAEKTAPFPWQRQVFDKLDALRDAWSDADAPPQEVGVLSRGEYLALVVACGFERVLRNPVIGFLLLDGWLQEWVMRHRGMAHLVGTRIGVDDWFLDQPGLDAVKQSVDDRLVVLEEDLLANQIPPP